jgi:hypothetical protein
MWFACCRSPGIRARIIRWWSSSDVDHCELIFLDGARFSVLPGVGGIFLPPIETDMIEPAERCGWTVVKVHSVDEMRVRYWCEAHVGIACDPWGVVKSTFSRSFRSLASKWHVAEACASALADSNHPHLTATNPSHHTPGSLLHLLAGVDSSRHRAHLRPCEEDTAIIRKMT